MLMFDLYNYWQENLLTDKIMVTVIQVRTKVNNADLIFSYFFLSTEGAYRNIFVHMPNYWKTCRNRYHSFIFSRLTKSESVLHLPLHCINVSSFHIPYAQCSHLRWKSRSNLALPQIAFCENDAGCTHFRKGTRVISLQHSRCVATNRWGTLKCSNNLFGKAATPSRLPHSTQNASGILFRR